MDAIYLDIEDKLKQRLSTKVTVTSKGEGAGKIEIEFYNHEDLDRLMDQSCDILFQTHSVFSSQEFIQSLFQLTRFTDLYSQQYDDNQESWKSL